METGKEDEGKRGGSREGCLCGEQDDLWKKKHVFLGVEGRGKLNIENILATVAILRKVDSQTQGLSFFHSFVYSTNIYYLCAPFT